MSEPVNILIVDDLAEKLLVFQSILEELQQNLVLVHSGREALQQILERDFAVILLDVNMPDMDGFETAKLIRQYRRTKQTPIVFITAYMDDIQSMRGYALGAVDYISTPIIPEILRSKIKVFVDLYRMHTQLRRQAEEREALARAQAARDAAEVAMHRADLLAEASHIFARSLDVDTTVQGLLEFVAPQFAPVAIVASFDRRAAMRAHVAWREDIHRRVGAATLPPQMLAAITRVNIDEDMLVLPEIHWPIEAADFADGRKTTVALRRAKVLPLFARGRAIGAIVLGGPSEAIMPRDYDNDDTLLKEIASRAAIALENASLYRAIREGDRRKNEFLAMLSHELRNPLAPIRNAVHLLQNHIVAKTGMDAQPLSDEQARWATDIIARQVEHMAHIMDDLLDVSRIARGAVAIEQNKILLDDIIERSVETAMPLLDARAHQLHVVRPSYAVELQGDLVRLAQIFSNLLNNAVKYSPDGSDIWLEAVYLDEQVVISVRDNGHGIDAEFLPHIFDLFAQGNKSIERTQSGLGVGLTLVKHLTALHRGHIEARSAGLGKGAEFVVTLPASRAEQIMTAKIDPIKESPPMPGGRVLVVDDLESSAQSMKFLLELKGYEVEAAHDGPAALSAAVRFGPDVVLLDIGLPGMDGFEVARQLHQRMGDGAPFIIALTGYGQETDRAQSAAAGFDSHIVKPADIDALLAQIANYCAARAQRHKRIMLA